MLPPTMMIAPTSAMARPNAARNAVSSESRPMHQRDHDRRRNDGLRDDHGGWRKQQPGKAERARPRQQEVDKKTRHDRRQA
jgi:hypothetical protein